MPESEKTLPDPQSKSQVKKDMQALQKLGEQLMALHEAQLDKIPLPDDLREAIVAGRDMKANEARRRHLQFIGKKMRNVDCDEIKKALNAAKQVHDKDSYQFHQAERWREKLILGDDSVLQSFVEAYPECDRQQLRQLIRKAKQDRSNNKKTGGELSLFRVLFKLICD